MPPFDMPSIKALTKVYKPRALPEIRVSYFKCECTFCSGNSASPIQWNLSQRFSVYIMLQQKIRNVDHVMRVQQSQLLSYFLTSFNATLNIYLRRIPGYYM